MIFVLQQEAYSSYTCMYYFIDLLIPYDTNYAKLTDISFFQVFAVIHTECKQMSFDVPE